MHDKSHPLGNKLKFSFGGCTRDPHTPKHNVDETAWHWILSTSPLLASTLNLGGEGASLLVGAEQNLSLLPGCRVAPPPEDWASGLRE